jgi:catechol-2,3-dioxygenase
MNHAVLYVSDVERSAEFWVLALDMEKVAEVPEARAVFLRLRHGGNDHDLGLFGVGSAGTTVGRPPGLYHLAWQVDTIDELAAAKETLIGLGAFVGQSSHGTTKSLYGRDPDGIEFEVMWMLPRAEWSGMAVAVVEPLDLADEVARWSGVHTAHELSLPISG